MFKREFHFFKKDFFEPNANGLLSEHIEARDEVSFRGCLATCEATDICHV